jgi:hypothetical protein
MASLVFWTCLLILPLIWILARCYWDEICRVKWWTIEGFFHTPCFVGIWFWTLIFTQFVVSMLGAFTSSIITCRPSYTYTISVISWCITCFNYFLKPFITTIYSCHFMKLLGFKTSIALILTQTWIDSTQQSEISN